MSENDGAGLNPWSVLKAAVEAVPALRYAVGVAGLVSILAIIQAYKISPQYAGFGVIAILVLMVGVLVFARLAAANPEIFLPAVQAMLWAFTSLVIASAILLFTSVFFKWPLSFTSNPPAVTSVAPNGLLITPADRKIWYTEGLIDHLRSSWNGDDLTEAHNIARDASTYINDLENVANETLGVGGMLTKLDYLCFTRVMLADVESNLSNKITEALHARQACEKAQQNLANLESAKDKDNSHRVVQDFSLKNHEREWVSYLYASTFCTVGISQGDNAQVEKSRKLLRELPSWYIEESKPSTDSVFKRCVGEHS